MNLYDFFAFMKNHRDLFEIEKQPNFNIDNAKPIFESILCYIEKNMDDDECEKPTLRDALKLFIEEKINFFHAWK